MSKPWGTIGAWAAEAEREEAEEREAAAAAAAASQSFPSLKEAAATTTTKSKKKKMSLSEFTTGTYVGPGGAARRDASLDHKGLTPDEMLRLPTGPKERSEEEMRSGRLGGGFSSYGRSGMPSSHTRDRDGDSDSSWGGNRRSYGGGFDEDRPPRVSDFDQPSRADEVDNWASAKKPMPSLTVDSGRQNRYNSLGGASSRAEEVDNWGAGKKPIPVRSNTFGSGFRDSGPEPDRWTRGGLHESEGERRRLVLDPPRRDIVNGQVKSNRPSPFGAARPREEVLAEKGLDWKKLESEAEAKKMSRPTSSHSSRPSSAQSGCSEGPVRPKVNPFGDAKPREILLEEKGKNWRKIDLELEHRRSGRPETEAENILKEEIEQLKKGLEKESTENANRESLQGPNADQTNVHNLIISKERELEKLIHDLDDKVRFRPKSNERPGSGAGRVGSSFEDLRSIESMEQPQSHGTVDVWARSADDRRSFPSGRERGFLGDRVVDRSRRRDRW